MYTQNDIEKAYLSRGLGDVYKRQHYTSFSFQFHLELNHEFIIQFSSSYPILVATQYWISLNF